MTFEKQILEKIKVNQLKPISQAYFKIRNIILWCLLGVFALTLSTGFGMIIFAMKGTDFDLFDKLGLSIPEKIIYSIPSFWIIACLALIIIAYINFRNTRRGYRINARQFIFIALLVTLALGSIIYALNISKYVDDVASNNIPIYNTIVPLNTNRWLDPGHGLLSGNVREKTTDSDFILSDANLELWHVVGDNIIVLDNFKFQTGDRIKVIGEKIGDDLFQAKEIKQWK